MLAQMMYLVEYEHRYNDMKKILLTATGGGHLEQLKQLDCLRKDHKIKYLIDNNKVNRANHEAFHMPEYRVETKFIRYIDMIRIFFVSLFVLFRFRPDVVISTGAGTTFPVCWLQKKIFRKKVIFIESFARRTEGSKTGLSVYKFADHFIIQWETLRSIYPNAIFGGMIY